ncbi:MAG: hypothetical protein ACOCWM_02020 [Cyclobacteriaceae bacterium]
MKKKYSLIAINILGILVFSLSILLKSGYLINILALLFLLASAIYTAIAVKDKSFKKKAKNITQSLFFLITWNLMALALLIASIFVWSEHNPLLIFSIIFFSYSLGATLGQITRNQKNKKLIL